MRAKETALHARECTKVCYPLHAERALPQQALHACTLPTAAAYPTLQGHAARFAYGISLSNASTRR